MRIKFGEHEYEKDGTDQLKHCKFGCGCYVNSAESGGPAGLDPRGKCPNNIKRGKSLGEKKDCEYVVNQRIHSLESKIKRQDRQLCAAKKEIMTLRSSKRKIVVKFVGKELSSYNY